MSVPAESDLARFVYHEARLIDEQRYDEWFELFTEDALYWMPLTRGQPDGVNHTSLLYEDKLLLKVRIERLKSGRAFAQQQPSYCQHVLQAPLLESSDAARGEYVTRTPFVYVESQLDEQIVLAGVVFHHLVATDAGLRIRLKKAEIVNCDSALPSIQLFP
ncbi:MAG: aromatic-ring-hydroxylating dioxygenase subunit beta [Gammaproteobacteria bacterium]